MKKITMLSIAIIGTFTLFGISSCKKVWNEIKHHPDGAADNCRIDYVTFPWVNNYFDEGIIHYDSTIHYETVKIKYNSHGDPLSVIYADGRVEFENPKNSGFKYDNQYRLTAYLQAATADLNYGLNWHRYTYPNANTVIDTTFVYASGDFVNQDRPNFDADHPLNITVNKYTLDSYGRIIKFEGAYSDQASYTYNANGNLVLPGVTYTNKTNVFQTHKTWMFINRNYSLNAPVGQATAYNSNNLPTKVKYLNYFVIGSWDVSKLGDRPVTINYMCK